MDSEPAAPCIVVLGSLNMDIVLRVPRAPEAGETLLGRSIAHIPGGKGGNQAVSCARQGARVRLVGCVGDDDHGRALRSALEQDGVDTSAVRVVAGAPSGTALVMVDDAGQNRIVVVAGANAALEVDEAALSRMLRDADFLVVQLEVPMPQVARAIGLAHRSGCKVILNPSPVQPIESGWWPMVDTLVLNEVEARMLSGLPADTPEEAAAAGHALCLRGVARVVVTLGAAGAVAVDAQGARHHPARAVQVVDTTAAGDTLLGTLAVALASGATLDQALGLGIRAARICVAQPGAQSSIPARAAVLQSAPALPFVSL